jgi:hypothetical protein
MRTIGTSSLLLLLVLAEPAGADSLWEHNGSILQLREEGAERSFHYSQPRVELRKAGVRDGTVLFKGRKIGKRFSGTAYRFSKACGAVGYEVEGVAPSNSRNLTLSGRAPRRNSKCEVVGHLTDVLVFRRQASAEQPPVAATMEKKVTEGPQPKQQEREKVPSNDPEGKLPAESKTEQPRVREARVRLRFPVMGCKSRDTFDQWVETFRRADAASEAKVVAQGMKTKNCAALRDGPVEIVQADDTYLCVRPTGKTDCYWTLRASVR